MKTEFTSNAIKVKSDQRQVPPLFPIQAGETKVRTISALAFSVLAFIPSVYWAVPNSSCRLRAGIYQDKKHLSQARGSQTRDAKEIAIDREYMDYFRLLAESSLNDDQNSFDVCSDSAKNDPIASRMAAFVRYLHGGRANQDGFISSFPSTRAQLADFWLLDAIAMHGVSHGPASLPGISLPDGIVGKLLSELFVLVLQGNSTATRKYFLIYGNSNGEYAEFMDEQIRPLFQQHADLVLKLWPLIRPYKRHLTGLSEDSPPEFSEKVVQAFQHICEGKRDDQSCDEIIRIFK
jgi:hypothetical protein